VDEILQRLIDGVSRFQVEVFPERAEMFAQAASEKQSPHTLFITCADSRIDPVALTSSSTGEIFVARNIGNMVPAYGEMLGGVSAVIEFAVSSLCVRHIVICGHSHCGAMHGLLNPESVADMPTVKSWLHNAHAALSMAKGLQERSDIDQVQKELTDILTEQNVLLQMQHLKTHPSVASAMIRGKLTISGWIYNIGTGEVRIATDGELNFTPIGAESPIGVSTFR
jgi:carbonic anhydrase